MKIAHGPIDYRKRTGEGTGRIDVVSLRHSVNARRTVRSVYRMLRHDGLRPSAARAAVVQLVLAGAWCDGWTGDHRFQHDIEVAA